MMFGVKTGMILGAVLMASPAFLAGDLWGGHETAARKELERELALAQSQRDAANKDLAASVLAEARMARTVAEKQKAAQEAEDRLNGYKDALAQQGKPDDCLATDTDARWLSGARPAARRDPAPAPAGKPGLPGSGAVPGHP